MAMNRKLTIPRGKDVVRMTVTGHSYVRLLDENGQEIFRFQSPGRHVTAVVRPGRYRWRLTASLGGSNSPLSNHASGRRDSST